MQTECTLEPMRRARLEGRDGVADFAGGALLLGATDEASRLVDRFAACFTDGRAIDRIVHEVRILVVQRVFAIVLGYGDLNDHDDLRFDPVLTLFFDRLEPRRRRALPQDRRRPERRPKPARRAVPRCPPQGTARDRP